MTREQPTRLDLRLSFPGSRTYTYETELPADWYGSGYGLGDYVKHVILPKALDEAGLNVELDFPEGATGITANALEARQGFGISE